MSKTIIVSNRLPVKIRKKANELVYEPSEGGLATGLGSIYKKGDNLWVGWPGTYFTRDEQKKSVADRLRRENMSPVFLSKKEISEYYEGFSNSTLWPVFHYFNQYAHYEQNCWETYVKVNQKFCDAIVAIAEPGDTIWVQDYQLLLLPQMLRTRLPESRIGFFQHIPFPSFEIFRLLPWRRALLEGMLGADLIGFHTYDDTRHFLSSVNRIIGLPNHQGMVDVHNRLVMVDAFPMGIDYDRFANSAASVEVRRREKKYRAELGARKIILSIDRLDYSKGIPQRLKAFRLFLEQHPEFREKVSLVMQVVPSRDQVEKYKSLKVEIDELVGSINSVYRTMGWTPIQYFYRSFPFGTVSAFYRMADVALVTPMRDGMNLVCKEYIASRQDQKGVLILSEMAGASMELADAVLINPNDIIGMAEAMHTALAMPEGEQVRRMTVMQESLKRYNIEHWVALFMTRMEYIRERQKQFAATWLNNKTITAIRKQYREAKRRLIFLDYDGTLVPFNREPERASPDNTLLDILRELCHDKRNHVVIISGRDRYTLRRWLGDLPVDIIAEHGIWTSKAGGEWESVASLRNDWKQMIRPVFEAYVGRTPGTMIEEKEYALVWHYRKAASGLGEGRAHEMMSHLGYLVANTQLQVMEGDKIVEVKNIEVNKGTAVLAWIEHYKPDFLLAIGDDRTDEDIFNAIPEEAVTIKVGSAGSGARYNVPSYSDVRALLAGLAVKSAKKRAARAKTQNEKDTSKNIPRKATEKKQ